MDPTTLTLLLQAVPVAMKTGYLLFNKPKKSLYQNKELENTVQRLIANNQADIVNKTLMNQLTSQAKSLGARVYQQQQHALEIGREQGLLSSGQYAQGLLTAGAQTQATVGAQAQQAETTALQNWHCLLYTSDAADDLLCVDLGGRRIIKKKIKKKKNKA